VTRCERSLAAASSDPVLELNGLGALAYFFAIQGRSAEAQDLLSRCRGLMGPLGAGFWVPPVYFALAATWRDDPVAAERELRPGHLALTQVDEKSNFSSLAVVLAQAVYRRIATTRRRRLRKKHDWRPSRSMCNARRSGER
jgi:hypothetical protein